MSLPSNEPTNVGSLFFATNYWMSVLMHGLIRIFVTRLFGDLFCLFQSCPCDYQTNGARVRVTGIVVILTHSLNHADTFCQTLFCLKLFCLLSLLPVVNCACAHKTVGRYDGDLPQIILWDNLPGFQALVPILYGTCSNLPDQSTKNIGRSSIVIAVI